jgi:hypothetical protein
MRSLHDMASLLQRAPEVSIVRTLVFFRSPCIGGQNLSLEPCAQLEFQSTVRIVPLRAPQERLLKKAELGVSPFHEPTLRSVELWTSGPRAQALERSLLILHTQLTADAAGGQSRTDEVIRHYDLGVSPRVKRHPLRPHYHAN